MPLRFADEIQDDPFATPTNFQRVLGVMRSQPSALLLAAQFVGLLVLPFIHPTTFGRLGVSPTALQVEGKGGVPLVLAISPPRSIR